MIFGTKNLNMGCNGLSIPPPIGVTAEREVNIVMNFSTCLGFDGCSFLKLETSSHFLTAVDRTELEF